MKKIILILASLTLISCTEAEIKQQWTENGIKVTQSLIYTKDHRTNLCFAHSHPYSNWSVMANVPCSPEVEKLIKE